MGNNPNKKQRKARLAKKKAQLDKNVVKKPPPKCRRTRTLLLGDSMIRDFQSSKDFAIVRAVRGGTLQNSLPNSRYVNQSMFAAWDKFCKSERPEKLELIIVWCGRNFLEGLFFVGLELFFFVVIRTPYQSSISLSNDLSTNHNFIRKRGRKVLTAEEVSTLAFQLLKKIRAKTPATIIFLGPAVSYDTIRCDRELFVSSLISKIDKNKFKNMFVHQFPENCLEYDKREVSMKREIHPVLNCKWLHDTFRGVVENRAILTDQNDCLRKNK